jgi:hypothetical protein
MTLRLDSEAESAVWRLVRAAVQVGGWQGRIADALVEKLRPKKPTATPEPIALSLWVLDAPDLPPRPWRVGADYEFRCLTLGCDVRAKTCVIRQLASAQQRTRDTWRGQGTDYPHCVTEDCAQGRGIREALDPETKLAWRGAGLHGRFGQRRTSDVAAQQDAKRRLRVVGALDDISTLDVDPGPVESDG